MTFPQTRLTLIRRLSSGGSDTDWRQFLDDYWGPLCAFVMRWGGLSLADAEDVAGETFQALVKNGLLARWQARHVARLHTLLCAIAKNIVSNHARVAKGRQRILRELAERPKDQLPESIWPMPEPSEDEVDLFYRAWIAELLERCVQRLLTDLHRTGKGDYFRVLFGRLCEDLSTREVAEMLRIETGTAENYYKAARKRLADEMVQAVRQHVQRYCDEGSAEDEFRTEWSRLSSYLLRHGGLENTLRACHQQLASGSQPSRESQAFADTAARLRDQQSL